jgi:hypothetical protein
MPGNTGNRPPGHALTDAAIAQHLVRATRGEGRWYPLPDGGRAFACDTGDDLGGCPCCAHRARTYGLPRDGA